MNTKTKAAIQAAMALILSGAATAAWAADKACLIEGDMVIFNKTTPTKDCLENAGVPSEQFTSVCQSIAKIAGDMTKAFGGAAPKTTYMPACPPQAKASCVGFFGQPMTSYYYLRSAEELAGTQQSCVAQGGKWRQ
jgi:hypothetical protein